MTPTNDRPREDDPPSLRTVALSAVMGLLALTGGTGVLAFVVLFLADSRGKWNFANATMLVLLVVVAAIGVWGLLKLRPWKFEREPLSPATRRTNRLFAWSGLLAMPAALLLVYGTRGTPAGLFSNSPIAPVIAIAFMAFYVVGMALGWWWYASTDEHDRKAYDFGSLVACGLFTTVTPAWWVAARAGFMPQPNAMVLWWVTTIVLLLGWAWRKYR